MFESITRLFREENRLELGIFVFVLILVLLGAGLAYFVCKKLTVHLGVPKAFAVVAIPIGVLFAYLVWNYGKYFY